jgi:hypothetical protein
MQPIIDFCLSRRHEWSVFLLVFSIASTARAADASLDAFGSPQAVAFARYVVSKKQPDSLANCGTVGVIIEASLPGLYKSATLVAIRVPGQNKRGDLQVVQIGGDGTVAAEVIDRYFALRELIDSMPQSSVAITPANYKFRFGGAVGTGGSTAYIYHITPRKNRPGMMSGQLWMDSDTGQEVMLAGSFSNAPDTAGKVEVVRETKMAGGSAYGRITHVAFTVPRLGRAELVITEAVLNLGLAPRSE